MRSGQVPGHQALGPSPGGGTPMDVGAEGGGQVGRDAAGQEGPDHAREHIAGAGGGERRHAGGGQKDVGEFPPAAPPPR